MARTYNAENQTGGMSKLVDTSIVSSTEKSNKVSLEDRARQRKTDYWDVLKKCSNEELEVALYRMSDEGFKDYIDRKVLENNSVSISKIGFGIIFGVIGLWVIKFVLSLIISAMALIGWTFDAQGESSSNDTNGYSYEEYPYTPYEDSDGWDINEYLDSIY